MDLTVLGIAITMTKVANTVLLCQRQFWVFTNNFAGGLVYRLRAWINRLAQVGWESLRDGEENSIDSTNKFDSLQWQTDIFTCSEKGCPKQFKFHSESVKVLQKVIKLLKFILTTLCRGRKIN